MIEQLTQGFLLYFIAKCAVRVLISSASFISLSQIEQLKVESYRRNITRSLTVIDDLKKGEFRIFARVLALMDVVFFALAFKVLIGLW